MNFFKFFASSAALFALCACDGNEFVLAFNTQNVPPQTYYLETSLNAILSATDSVSATPEAMNTHLNVRATNSLLTAYDDGSAKFQLKIDSVDYKSDKRSVEEFRSMERYMSTEHFQFKMAKDGSVRDPFIEDSVMLGTEALEAPSSYQYGAFLANVVSGVDITLGCIILNVQYVFLELFPLSLNSDDE